MWPSLSGSLDSGDTSSPINNIATYIEDYIDLVENVPNDVIRQITQLHEHNHHYQQLLATLETNLEILSTCSAATPSSSSSSSITTSAAAPVSDTSISSTTSDEKNNFRKRKCLLSIQRCLIEIQEISDDKLFIIQSVLDQLDSKARQLDYDYRNVIVNTNSSYQGSSKHYSNNLSSLNSSAAGDAEFNKDSQYLNNSNSNVNLNSNNESTNHLNSKDTLINSTAATSGNCNSNSPTHNTIHSSSTHNGKRARRTLNSSKGDNNGNNNGNSSHNGNSTGNEYTGTGKRSMKRVNKGNKETKRKAKDLSGNNSPPAIYEDTPIDPDEPTYCLCKQVSFGEMIGCDNDACPIEWFHFSCVALSSKPKGRWYCPDCRGDRSNIPKK